MYLIDEVVSEGSRHHWANFIRNIQINREIVVGSAVYYGVYFFGSRLVLFGEIAGFTELRTHWLLLI